MFTAGSMRWRMGLLIVAALGLYLLGNDRVGLWDRDEPRYAQTSRQMLQSGDWVVPRLLDDVRTAKPVFIYWCQAGAMAILTDTAFAARLPSVIAMTLTLILLAVTLTRAVGQRRAFWTIFVLATSILIILSAKMCLTDSILLLWITIAQLCLFAIYRGDRSWRVAMLMWVAVGLATLTKGPVVYGMLGAAMITLALLDLGKRCKSAKAWREAIGWWWYTRPLVGLLVAAAFFVPWMVAVERRSPGFLGVSLGHDVIQRMTTGLEQHSGPPGYYLLTIWGMYFPWSLLLVASLMVAWSNRRLAPIRYALATIIGPWIMMELVQTKLPHYLLPIYPAMAFLTGDLLVRCIRGQCAELHRRRFIISVGIWAVITAVLGAAPWLAARHFSNLPIVIMAALTSFAAVYALAVFVRFKKGQIAPAALAMGGGIMILIALIFDWYLPSADFLRLSQRAADALLRVGATVPGQVRMIDYKEPSLAFYQGGTIRPERHSSYFTTTDPSQWKPWLVITGEVWEKIPPDRREKLEVVEKFRGLSYADQMRIIELMVVRTRNPGRATTNP